MSKESVKPVGSVRTVVIVGRRTLVAVAGCAALVAASSAGVARLGATSSDDRDEGARRVLRVTKECSQYTGAAGSFCTITGSNVP